MKKLRFSQGRLRDQVLALMNGGTWSGKLLDLRHALPEQYADSTLRRGLDALGDEGLVKAKFGSGDNYTITLTPVPAEKQASAKKRGEMRRWSEFLEEDEEYQEAWQHAHQFEAKHDELLAKWNKLVSQWNAQQTEIVSLRDRSLQVSDLKRELADIYRSNAELEKRLKESQKEFDGLEMAFADRELAIRELESFIKALLTGKRVTRKGVPHQLGPVAKA